MSTRYPGGFINRSAPVVVGPVGGEGGSAPGIWTLEQAGYYRSKNLWPKPLAIGGLWGIGSNDWGQLGQNNTIYRSSPVQVGSLTTWRNISGSGTAQTIATQFDGTLWAWGRNNYGQLGQTDRINRSSPVQVGANTTWLNIAGGRYHTIATQSNGSLWAWGRNTNGQLGQGDTTNRSSPVQIGALTTWNNIASFGSNTVLATKTDGSLWSWGQNSQGQLGQNIAYSSNVNSPTQVGSLTTWLRISIGYQALATKTDGSLWSWGYNNYGQLGQNDIINRSSPVQVGTLTTWSNISVGFYHTLAIKTDGTLWSWGINNNGELGQGNTISRSSPVQIGALTNWSILGAAASSSIAIKTDGTLWAWGNNGNGQLGQNNVSNYSSPVQVGLLSGWSRMGSNGNTTFAIKQ